MNIGSNPPLKHRSPTAWLKPPAPPEVEEEAGDPQEAAELSLYNQEGVHLLPRHGHVFRIGSDPDACQICVQGKSVSRTHAWGYIKDGQFFIQDAHSRHGTTVNGTKLEAEKWTPVPWGSAISLGDSQLQLNPTCEASAPQLPEAATLPLQSIASGSPSSPVFTVSLKFLEKEAKISELRASPSLNEALETATVAMASKPGLVELPTGIPTLIITDLHARRDYLLKALESKNEKGEKLFDLLKNGRLNVVCVGDGMHSEHRSDLRWSAIDAQASEALPRGGTFNNQALHLMDQEMTESLGVMKMVMDLKTSFPENFHFLRGNHEDVKGHFFFRYAKKMGGSELVREWMKERLGADFIERYAKFEDAMPLMARGQGFVVSHAPPARAVTRAEVEARDSEARQTLTWTDNAQRDEAGHYLFETPEHTQAFEESLANLEATGSHWFSGHKPVHEDEHEGRYRTQFDGRMVQFNNPDRHVVAWVEADGKFDPETGVRWLT